MCPPVLVNPGLTVSGHTLNELHYLGVGVCFVDKRQVEPKYKLDTCRTADHLPDPFLHISPVYMSVVDANVGRRIAGFVARLEIQKWHFGTLNLVAISIQHLDSVSRKGSIAF